MRSLKCWLAGRLPLAGRPGEIAVDQNGARALGLHVGSTLAMKAIPAGPSAGAEPGARRAPLRERVVGIIVTRGSFTDFPAQGRQIGARWHGQAPRELNKPVQVMCGDADPCCVGEPPATPPLPSPAHAWSYIARRRGTHSRGPPGPSSPGS